LFSAAVSLNAHFNTLVRNNDPPQVDPATVHVEADTASFQFRFEIKPK